MDVESWRLCFEIGQFLLTGAVAIYVYLTNKDKVTNDRITLLEGDIDKKIDEHGDRITRVETRIESSLGLKDLKELYGKVNQVEAIVNRLEGELSGAQKTLDLIHETLMEGRR